MRRPGLLLALVLVAAAALRFTGLTWGLGHTPQRDERVFVESAWQMRVSGDWDQRFYEYPGLVFDLLAVAFLALPAAAEAPPAATAVARGLVAGFGVLSVALVYAIGNRLLGRRAGLFAAALLAVSPVEVETAHMVRPDVILETFVLLTFLALASAGRGAGADLGAGLALGGALAAKLTGWLLPPVYVAGRLLAPGGSARRLALTLLLALGVMVVLTPSLVLRASAVVAGVRDQLAFHYTQPPTFLSWARLVAFYAGVALRALGPIGLVLAVAGVVLAWGDLRSWLGIVLFPGVLVAVLSTAVVGHDRLLVPALGLLALLAAGAFDAAAERRSELGLALAGATLAVPLAFSVVADVRFLRATPYDRALGWLEARPQDRVLFIYNRLKLGSPRFEVRPRDYSVAQNRLLARHFDLVASPPGEPEVAGFRLERPADPSPGWPGPHWPQLAFYSPGPLAIRYQPVDLLGALFTGSEGGEAVRAVADGEPDTAWSAAADGWIQVDFAAPVTLGRILAVGTAEGCPLARAWTSTGASWTEPTTIPMGPALVLDPAPVRGLRVAAGPGCAGRFRVAELRLESAAGAP